MDQIQPGIFLKGKKLYTKNADPGKKAYNEELIQLNDAEYREWNPYRSKIAAAVKNDIDLGINSDDNVLYLGASSGTTVSHISDILNNGYVFAVEYSQTVARDLVNLAENRDNIVPIIGDARTPDEYSDLVKNVDVVFQDISQKDQAEIFVRNCEKYLEKGDIALLCLKAHSISTTRDENKVFEEVKKKLTKNFELISETRLEPYEKKHLFLKLEPK